MVSDTLTCVNPRAEKLLTRSLTQRATTILELGVREEHTYNIIDEWSIVDNLRELLVEGFDTDNPEDVEAMVICVKHLHETLGGDERIRGIRLLAYLQDCDEAKLNYRIAAAILMARLEEESTDDYARSHQARIWCPYFNDLPFWNLDRPTD